MPRITRPEALFFPVVKRPIYTKQHKLGSDREIRVPNKLAVVNAEKGEVLGVVGKSYRLVTNREACAYARECAKARVP